MALCEMCDRERSNDQYDYHKSGDRFILCRTCHIQWSNETKEKYRRDCAGCGESHCNRNERNLCPDCLYYEYMDRVKGVYSEEWARRNKNSFNAYHRKYNQERRANKNNLTATLTTEQWQWLCKQTDQHCIYCGQMPDNLAQEHVIPVKQNGGYTIENIRPACKSCNSKKGAKTPEQAGMKLIEEYEARIQAGLKWKQDKLF